MADGMQGTPSNNIGKGRLPMWHQLTTHEAPLAQEGELWA